MDWVNIIKAIAPIFSAIASIIIVLYMYRYKKIKKRLINAYQEIRFLQAVEKVHLEMNIGRGETSNKNKVRSIVREELKIANMGWTPSLIEKHLRRLN